MNTPNWLFISFRGLGQPPTSWKKVAGNPHTKWRLIAVQTVYVIGSMFHCHICIHISCYIPWVSPWYLHECHKLWSFFIPVYYYIPVISHDHVIPILFGCRCIYVYSIMISHYIILSTPQYILYFCLYCTYTMILISEHYSMVSYIKSYISYRITPISIYYGTLYY